MRFQDVKASDGGWARPLLEAGEPKSCEYAFANIFMWSRVYNTKITRFEDFCIVRGEDADTLYYLYPAGRGDRRGAVEAVLQDAKSHAKQPVLYSLTQAAALELEEWFPGHFRVEDPRGQADYIYNAADLATLKGKKYQKKRNHCAHFERAYPSWGFYEIMPDTMDAIVAFNNRWANLYDNRGNAGIADENEAIQLALGRYGELGFKGGYIAVNGEIAAFSFGSALGDTFVTHVEKGLYDIPGAYNIINREMARHYGSAYTYINRENDVDEEGLRNAKLSYHPAWLEPKLRAWWVK